MNALDFYENNSHLVFDGGKITVLLEDSEGNRLTLQEAKDILAYWTFELGFKHGFSNFSTVWAYGGVHLFYSRAGHAIDIVV